MKQVTVENIRKVVIEHEYYNWTTTTVCDASNYIDCLNYLASKGVKIFTINFYE